MELSYIASFCPIVSAQTMGTSIGQLYFVYIADSSKVVSKMAYCCHNCKYQENDENVKIINYFKP